MKKKLINFIGFFIVFGLCFSYFHKVFSFKYGDGIYGLTSFYEMPKNSIDVFFVGSSLAFEDVNTDICTDEFNVSSFILAGSVQPLWNSYHYIKEGLKTQKPKLICLEASKCVHSGDYIDDSRIIKNVAGMKWSANKIEALKVSAPKERWLEFGLEFVQYHQRYKNDITQADFLPYLGNEKQWKNWRGFGDNKAVNEQKRPNVVNNYVCTSMYSKTEKYYRMIIELCKDKNIPLFIFASPYAGYNEGAQNIYNEAARIATEYNVPFENYNEFYDEMGLDFEKDCADIAHLSSTGNQKFTRFLMNDLIKKKLL